MRTTGVAVVVPAAVLSGVLTGCGPGWVPVSADPGRAQRVAVGDPPDPGPLPSLGPPGTRPAGPPLPQRGPQGTEVYLGWKVVGVDPSGRVLRLVSHGFPDPDLPGCGSVPVAVQVDEGPTEVTVGLLGPRPAPAEDCPASLLVAFVDVPLWLPPAHRALYRWTG